MNAKHNQDHAARIIYIPHGGGPMPLLNDPGHKSLIDFLESFSSKIKRPEAILIISAHWEEACVSLTSASAPELIYDYGGFPPETYTIQYPAPGNPGLSHEIAELLESQSIPARLDEQRGFDHGMFVPLKLMYPEADIPCIQLSLLNSLSAQDHIVFGKALAPLKEKNILIVGSGMSFHNLRSFFMPGLVSEEENIAFDTWLKETCSSEALTLQEREHRLENWQQAPAALKCHPRPEHLLPLHVCFGIACDNGNAEVVFSDEVMGRRVSGFLW
jgi:aromatic ring-opening dioxygenase catalytic subunit (LigB family)